MTNAEKAEKIRDAIFARSHDEGGAISKEQMADAIEGVLNKMALAPPVIHPSPWMLDPNRPIGDLPEWVVDRFATKPDVVKIRYRDEDGRMRSARRSTPTE